MIDRDELIRDVFNRAAECPDDERSTFLDETCGDDAGLRAEVESLLAHLDEAPGFVRTLPNGFTPLELTVEAPEDRLVGQRLGAFEVTGRIAEGGSSTVYRARQDRPARDVAIKLLRGGALAEPRRRRFDLEAEVLARLHHPGIAQVISAGELSMGGLSRPFLVMEYVDGPTLDEHLRDAEPDLETRLRLLVDLCDAVHHAHTRGVIHRDLKPANILVDGAGRPRILDFGIARLTGADIRTTAERTREGQLAGTVCYMSPEQARGDLSEVGTPSDVYALGVIGYEMLTGRLPYDLSGATLAEALRIVSETEPGPPSRLSRAVRGDLEAVLLKALAKVPGQRYQSAAELAADLRRCLAGEPVVARRPGALAHVFRFVRRHRAVSSSAAVAVILLGVAVAGTGLGFVRAGEKEREADAILELLNDLLQAVEMDETVIDEAAVKLEENFADRPLLWATLAEIIGAVYSQTGQYEDAHRHLGPALAVLRRELGDEHLHTASAMGRLGALYMKEGRYREALPLLEQAHAVERDRLGVAHEVALSTAIGLASSLGHVGRDAEADALLDQVIASAPTGTSELVLRARNTRATLRRVRGEHDRAAALLQELLDDCHAALGEEHMLTQTVAHNRALTEYERGRFQAAEDGFRRTIEVRTDLFGPGHLETLQAHVGLAAVLLDIGENDEAEAVLTSLLPRLARRLSPESDQILRARYLRAVVHERKKRYAEAEAEHREVLEIRRRLYGDDVETLNVVISRAVALGNLRRFQEAASQLEEALALQVEAGRVFKIAMCEHYLAQMKVSLRDVETALELSASAVEHARAARGERHWQVGVFITGRANALGAAGQFEEAARILEPNVTFLEETGARPGHVRNAIELLIKIYRVWGRPDDAARWDKRLRELSE